MRSQAGTILPATEFPSSTSTITWYEDGVSVDASFHDLPQTEVVDVLNGLTWKSGDHLAGFASPATGSIRLLGEAHDDPGASAEPATQVDVSYRDSVQSISLGEGRQVRVSATEATGDSRTGYLRTRFHGDPSPDGSVRSYDPDYGTLTVVFGTAGAIRSMRTGPQ